MNDRALREARRYLEQSVKTQRKLGYTRPVDGRVLAAAVEDAAQTVQAYLRLRSDKRA